MASRKCVPAAHNRPVDGECQPQMCSTPRIVFLSVVPVFCQSSTLVPSSSAAGTCDHAWGSSRRVGGLVRASRMVSTALDRTPPRTFMTSSAWCCATTEASSAEPVTNHISVSAPLTSVSLVVTVSTYSLTVYVSGYHCASLCVTASVSFHHCLTISASASPPSAAPHRE